MEKRELICIGCPMGCPLTVTLDGGAVVTVQGNTCPRGDAYARKEVTAPTRIVTTTVRVTGGVLAAVSCKTRTDIPKDKIFAVVRALKAVTVAAPVTIGQVVLPNAAATRLVMTMNARELMPLTPSENRMSVSFLQAWKACCSILVTLLPIVTSVSALQPSKVQEAIPVTPSGMVISVRLWQL